MNKKDLIKLEIERLNGEKHDIEFEIDKIWDAFIQTLIIVTAIFIGTFVYIHNLILQIFFGTLWIVLIILPKPLFMPKLYQKDKELAKIKKDIKEKYFELLKR